VTAPPGDAVALLRALVRADSRNPSLVPGGPGEGEIARLLGGVLKDWGFRVALQEAAPGRPNVIARIGAARPGAPVLMFNGHLDVVDVERMTHPPFDAPTSDGRLYGRGATDMKGGVAAMCAAAWRAAQTGMAGEIVIAAVVDEEFESAGTRALVRSGVRADAAIVTEPTRLAIAPAHRGFTWTEVTVRGRAAHGSRYDVGIDAIRHAGHLLAELDALEAAELVRVTHPLLGHASLHAATIEGGVGWSTYPASCRVRLERRTLPGERPEEAVGEVRDACERVRRRVPDFEASVAYVFSQEASDVPVEAPIVVALRDALVAGNEPVAIDGLSAWTDAALLNAAGIPAICYGPGDISMAHAAEEWVSIDEVERAAAVLTTLARDWCGRS
jgi:acetylornithine deacetylase